MKKRLCDFVDVGISSLLVTDVCNVHCLVADTIVDVLMELFVFLST